MDAVSYEDYCHANNAYAMTFLVDIPTYKCAGYLQKANAWGTNMAKVSSIQHLNTLLLKVYLTAHDISL